MLLQQENKGGHRRQGQPQDEPTWKGCYHALLPTPYQGVRKLGSLTSRLLETQCHPGSG